MMRKLALVLFILAAQYASAQVPTGALILKNDSLVGNNAYEFDMYIARTGSTPMELAQLQAIMTIDTTISSGILTFTINSATSGLNPSQQPTNGDLSVSGNELRLFPKAPPGAGNGTIVPLTPGVRIGRFRVSSSVPFANLPANLAWKTILSGSNPYSKVWAYVTATNTEITDFIDFQTALTNPSLSPVVINSSSPLPGSVAGTPYADTLAASGGTPPYSWSLLSGSLPNGDSLVSTGIIRGIPTTAGTYVFIIRVTDNASGTASKSFSLSVVHGAASKLLFRQQPANTTAGVTISPSITVQVTDANGNDVPVSGDFITVSLLTGTGTLSGTKTRTTNSSGLATFNNLSINKSGAKTLRAVSFSGYTAVNSASFTINPAGPTSLAFGQQPVNTTAGAIITPPVTAELRDAFGNNVPNPNVSVLIALTTGTGALSGTTTQLTDSTGFATFDDLNIDLKGSKNLTVSSSPLSPATSSSFTINVGPPSKLAFVQQPSSGVAGAVISPPVTVQVEDSSGNGTSTPGDSVVMSLTSGTGTLSGTLTRVTNASGLATFNDLSINQPGTKNLTASATGLAPATSAPFTMGLDTITASSGPHGLISPSGVVTVANGGSQTFTITPNTGYHLDSLIVDGVRIASAPSYTFNNVTSDHTIRVTFAINQYTITATAGSNGSISPFGAVTVNYGASQTFDFTPATGYHLDSLIVDGIRLASAPSYTFTNDTSNHTIRVTFAIDQFAITSSAGPNGLISPSGAVPVSSGASQTFNITSGTGYHIDSLIVDGVRIASAPSYTFNNVTSDHTIRVTFAINQYTITAIAGPNGTISPSGAVTVNYGASQTFNFTPATSYHVDSLIVDGIRQPSTPSYTFTNDTANHTIRVTFAINQFTINATAGPNGTISPSGVVNINSGGSQLFNFTPNTGYHVDSLIVDGIRLASAPSYTFTNDTSNHTIRVTFALTKFTITATAGPNGTINPSGAVTVNYGANQTFTFTPIAHFHVDSLIVDGVLQPSAPSYTFTSDTSDHTIRVAFAINQFTINAAAGPNGTINPSGAVVVNYGASQAFTFTPNTGYYVDSLIVDGVRLASAPGYTFTNDTSNHTIRVTFATNQYVISASAGTNGSISPSGAVAASYGSSQTFNFTPNTGYHVDSLIVDGALLPSATSYTFTNVTANHTIRVSFAPDVLTITVQTSPSGRSVIVDGVRYPTSPRAFAWLAASNHTIGTDTVQNRTSTTRYIWTSWNDSGAWSHGVSSLVSRSYTASFKSQHYLTMSANPGGTVDPPSGWQDSSLFVGITAIPDAGFGFTDWSGTGAGSYSGANNPGTVQILAPITEVANFIQNPVLLTIQTTPPGLVYRVDGFTKTTPYTITFYPATTHVISTDSIQNETSSSRMGYKGWSDGGAISHTILFPGHDTTITATFKPQYLLTMSAGGGGTVSPASAFYDSGKVVAISATPSPGYSFSGWNGTGTGSYTGPNNPANATMGGPLSETGTFTLFPVHVTIRSNPHGRSSIVDGFTYPDSQAFIWSAGQPHTIATSSPQGDTATRYLWSSWNDGGTQSHSVAPLTDSTFIASFSTQYYLTMIATPGGTVSPSGWYNAGQSAQFSAAPDVGYHFASWTGAGAGSYSGTVSSPSVVLNNPIRETANFAVDTMIVTATAGPNGSIAPSGAVKVPYGSSQTFTFTPASGYHVDRVIVDSVVQAPAASYTFNGVTSNHTIRVTFALNAFTITATAGPNGAISPSGIVGLSFGDNQTFTFTPNTGYHIANVIVDSVSLGALPFYTFGNVRANHTISVSFAINLYVITASAGANGSISPSGADTVAYGSDATFTITPNTGYHVDSLIVDGAGVALATHFTFPAVAGNHTIRATFGPDGIQITIQTNPPGLSVVVDGATYTNTQTFNWTAGTPHTVSIIDSIQNGPAGTRYVWTSWSDSGSRVHNVTPLVPSTYTANFVTQFYLTMIANVGGTVSPQSRWVNNFQDVAIDATPSTGYAFRRWTGTGTGSYTGFSGSAAVSMGSPITETASFIQNNFVITVQTNPPGRTFTVYGEAYTTPQTFSITPGTSLFLGAPSPQSSPSPGTQYAWKSWSDTGAENHEFTPTSDRTITAFFGIQYTLAVHSNPPAGGVTNPAADTAYDAGDTAVVAAIPNSHYALTQWTGDASGLANRVRVAMTGPKSVTANFGPGIDVTVTSVPPGRTVTVDDVTFATPGTFHWIAGSQHSVATANLQLSSPQTRFLWRSWSDSGALSHVISPIVDKTITGNFTTQFYVQTVAGSGGSVSPASAWHDSTSQVILTATANTGYGFIEWIGNGSASYSGTKNPALVTVIGGMTQTGTFGTLLPPPTLSGIADGDTNLPTSLMFNWNRYPGAVSYDMQVATDSLFSNIAFDITGISDTSKRIDTLANLTRYYWRVRARAGAGITLFSSYRKFSTMTAVIAATSPSRNWGTGFTFPVRWSSTDLSGNVNVRLSLDGGRTYRTILVNIANTGRATWPVPDTTLWVSNTCKLLIESNLNHVIRDSSVIFSISPGRLPSTVPLSTSIPFPPNAGPSTAYRLVGGAGLVDTIKVRDILGGKQRFDWRMFSENGGTVNYLDELSAASVLTTGRGYWLLKKGNFDLSATILMPPLNSDATYNIQLHPGWNIIAEPFDKSVPWSTVRDLNNLSPATKLYGYSDAFVPKTALDPFRGYYFFNDSNLASLQIPYPFGGAPPARGLPAAHEEGSWSVQMALESDINRDAENYIGVSPGLTPGTRAGRGHKPPLFLDQSFLFFPRPEWDATYTRFNTDIRPSLGKGQVWNFEVSNPRKSVATIHFDGLDQVPAGNEVVLINRYETTPVDLRNSHDYRFSPVTENTSFTLIIGTKTFVENEIRSQVPAEFELAQNFPNPFNSSTLISVKLPHDAYIRLEVYSILGQKIKQLADGLYSQGIHSYVWEGTDQAGVSVSSGVYFYRLTEGSNIIQTKKMIITK